MQSIAVRYPTVLCFEKTCTKNS